MLFLLSRFFLKWQWWCRKWKLLVFFHLIRCFRFFTLIGVSEVYLGGGFKYVLFSTLPGEMIQFGYCNMFQRIGSTTNQLCNCFCLSRFRRSSAGNPSNNPNIANWKSPEVYWARHPGCQWKVKVDRDPLLAKIDDSVGDWHPGRGFMVSLSKM